MKAPLPILPILAISALVLSAWLISCGTSNPNYGRALISIAVSPTTADAQNFPNGQVTYTATGTFNQPPLAGPVSSSAPYNGAFAVNQVNGATVATISSTGTGTATVQCVAGQSGTAEVYITANANNGTQIVVSGSASITCP